MTAQSTLPGVVGVVGLTNHPVFGHRLTVDGAPAPREKGVYVLPGAGDEPVRARLKGALLREHPVIRIDGQNYHTGPVTPLFLLVIAFLPLLFLMGGSWFSLLLVVLGLLFNFYIVRTKRLETWKTFVILLGFVAAVVAMVVFAFVSGWLASLVPR